MEDKKQELSEEVYIAHLEETASGYCCTYDEAFDKVNKYFKIKENK